MLEPFFSAGLVEAGCDEAGRGCLAGPVFAAAVVLPRDFSCPELDDSKKLSERQRRALRPVIESAAIAWCVQEVSAAEIDRINILNASFLAMTRAVQGLSLTPELLLVDGNRFRSALEIPYRCIIKGDGKYASIAAASILAKTHRDDCMERLDADFPAYGWRQNKGYPTLAHRRALGTHGLSPHHRVSFSSDFVQPTLF